MFASLFIRVETMRLHVRVGITHRHLDQGTTTGLVEKHPERVFGDHGTLQSCLLSG